MSDFYDKNEAEVVYHNNTSYYPREVIEKLKQENERLEKAMLNLQKIKNKPIGNSLKLKMLNAAILSNTGNTIIKNDELL